jgi:hypothetical protein
MSSTNISKVSNKDSYACGKNDTFYFATDRRSGVVIRTESRYFDITACPDPFHDGHIDGNDGVVPDAIEVPGHEVADLVAASHVRAQQLERIESLLIEWIEIRRAKSRRAKNRLSLQKREVAK